MDKIRVENVSFAHDAVALFGQVNLSLTPGEALIVIGKSGCGKSTFLEICAGLRTPATGRVFWDGVDILELTRHDIMEARQKMGYVFQLHALISNFPVFNNVALPLQYHCHIDEKEIRGRVMEQLERFGILHLERKLPEALSMGEAKRAALARALIMKPQLLFLDDVLSGLDPESAHAMVTLLEEIRHTENVTMLIVSHSSQTFLKNIKGRVTLLDKDGLQ